MIILKLYMEDAVAGKEGFGRCIFLYPELNNWRIYLQKYSIPFFEIFLLFLFPEI